MLCINTVKKFSLPNFRNKKRKTIIHAATAERIIANAFSLAQFPQLLVHILKS